MIDSIMANLWSNTTKLNCPEPNSGPGGYHATKDQDWHQFLPAQRKKGSPRTVQAILTAACSGDRVDYLAESLRRKYCHPYLEKQVDLEPHPVELQLRNQF